MNRESPENDEWGESDLETELAMQRAYGDDLLSQVASLTSELAEARKDVARMELLGVHDFSREQKNLICKWLGFGGGHWSLAVGFRSIVDDAIAREKMFPMRQAAQAREGTP